MESHPKILPVTTFRALFQIPTDNPGLMQSQVKALSAQVPLLYFIVFMNTVAVAWTHYGIAPDSLTIGFPIIVLISGLIRGWAWMQSRGQAISNADASRRLEMSVVVSGAFGVMFLAWGLGLYQYGDAYAQGHVAFYMAITVISSIFCTVSRPAPTRGGSLPAASAFRRSVPAAVRLGARRIQADSFPDAARLPSSGRASPQRPQRSRRKDRVFFSLNSVASVVNSFLLPWKIA